MSVPVNVDNFIRAESDRMFADLQTEAGGVNRLFHHRTPASVDKQTVIRMNRDTLYTTSIVDISEGATVTVPNGGGRYLSVMVVNQDHFVNRIYHEPGDYALTVAEFDTPWVQVGMRVLVDPNDPKDVATVNAVQDQMSLAANSANPFTMPDYDHASFDATRQAVLELTKHAGGFEHAFGKKDDVNDVRHLLGTAAGWGGLPDAEARYLGVFPDKPVGRYKIEVGDVPVDGFWSITVYNAAGFLEPNAKNVYSVNNLTAKRNDDGTVTVGLGPESDDRENLIPITDGWNYVVRLYRPRREVLDGSWTFPAAESV